MGSSDGPAVSSEARGGENPGPEPEVSPAQTGGERGGHSDEDSSWPNDSGSIAAVERHLSQQREAIISPLIVGVWLLPILGFIGTVVGITQAIAQLKPLLSVSMSSEAMMLEGAMAGVLSGLSYAFDTTLVGLILVIPVKITLEGLDVFLMKIQVERLARLEPSFHHRGSFRK